MNTLGTYIDASGEERVVSGIDDAGTYVSTALHNIGRVRDRVGVMTVNLQMDGCCSGCTVVLCLV